jgi:hypothetical protein
MKSCSVCKLHKPFSDFYRRGGNRSTEFTSECRDCFRDRMHNRHQKHKDILVKEHGGKCSRCEYSVSQRILHFHHIDPTTKSFEIADKLSANLDILREEAKKCILLCPNCHGEKHQKIW